MTSLAGRPGGARGFPVDDYTPYGYLNLPGHASRANPKGVMRGSIAGLAWHAPAYAAGYGGRVLHYRAGLALPDLDPVSVAVDHHSSAVLGGVLGSTRLTWFAGGDDVLVLRVEGAPGTSVTVTARYDRVVAAAGQWGESGLLARLVDATGDVPELVLQSFEDGEAFAVRGGDWSLTDRIALGSRGDEVAVTATGTLTVADGPSYVVMARGRTAAEALERVAATNPSTVLADLTAADDAFWAGAPALSGDWPDHWRRGVVYDLETLRMMVRPPVGRYEHRWDAMQIQAPRVVLAEAAMDALALSWADPDLAAEMLLGTMASLEEPHVPCSREDGTYNMVAADGTVCGTGPQWGYPFVVADRLDRRLGSSQLRTALYERLAAYARFWRDERRGPDGWWGFACSWESGQDLSPRFGDQPWGGGHPVRQVRPVDLYASMIHATTVLETWCESVAPDDAAEWRQWRDELAEHLGRLWTGDRYADATEDGPTELVDVMHLSPAALGVADRRGLEAAGVAVGALDATELVWPMFVWTPVLAARRAGRPDVAGAVAAAVIDRAYRFWDRRDDDPTHTLPGIACEYWPPHGRCGGEGYGWGAFTTELLFGELVGLRPDPEGVSIRPALPTDWGGNFTVHLATPMGRGVINLRPSTGGTVIEAGPSRAITRWCPTGGPSARLTWSDLV